MKVSWDLLRFPLDDDRWQSKAVVGGLISLFAIFIWPLYLPLMGFGVRVMRQTVQGEPPSLPEWDNWGELFGDGLRYWVVAFVYSLPILVLMCCGLTLWVLALAPFAGGAVLAEQTQTPEVALAGFVGLFVTYGLGFIAFGIGTLLGIITSFLSLAAQTRWVATGSLGDAFQFGEVWRMVRGGFSNFLLAFAIWYGLVFVGSMIASMLVYTIVLVCLYPFLLGVLTLYSTVLMGSLYGMAYYHTQSNLTSTNGEPAPA